MEGSIFYADNAPSDTFRIGFGRVSDDDIETGIKIIGKNIKKLLKEKRWLLKIFKQSPLLIYDTLITGH